MWNEDTHGDLKRQPDWKMLTSLRDALVKMFLDKRNTSSPDMTDLENPWKNLPQESCRWVIAYDILNALFQYFQF